MPLAQRYVDPRYFGPALREYMAKGAYGGGGMSAPSLPQPQQAQNQIDPAAAVSLWKMLGSGEAGVQDEYLQSMADNPRGAVGSIFDYSRYDPRGAVGSIFANLDYSKYGA